MIKIEDYFIDTEEPGKLWMGRMGNPNGPAVLLIHGALENSKIFYSEKARPNGSSGRSKGLAPYLAENGFDVFVTDLRGKGKSTPLAGSGKIKGGQFEVIVQDIPSLVKKINQLKGENSSIHLMAHSWGGVLISSWYARFSNENINIKSIVFFACKRKIYVQHFRRWFMVDFIWSTLGTIATKIYGYLPAKKLRLGADDEPAKFFFECNKWVYSNKWIDPRDQFNYNEAFENVQFPPVLSLTGIGDHSLGNKYCVNKMLDEIKPTNFTNLILSKENGNKNNYGHIDILTHPDAPIDHFPSVLNWLNHHK